MTLLYPRARYLPVPYATRPMNPKSLGLILHVQQGNNSLARYFANSKNGAMSHFWVAKDGRVEQYQSLDRISWAQAAGNDSYHSVETEGFVTEPLTQAQIQALAQLYAWGITTLRWLPKLSDYPGSAGFGWHGMGGPAWGGHTGCPGNLRKPQRAAVLALITAPPTPPRKVTKMVLVHDPATQRVYLQDNDGLHYITQQASIDNWKNAGVPGPTDIVAADLASLKGYIA